MRSLLLIGVVTAVLSGCALLRPAQAQKEAVEVREVTARFIDETRADFALRLAVENRAPLEAKIVSFSWEVWIDGRWFAAGSQQATAEVAAGSTHHLDVTLPVVFRRTGIRPGVHTLDVGVRGGVMLSYAGVVERVPFASKQRIQSMGAPMFDVSDELE